MKYRIKLLFAFLSLVFISTLLAVVISYFESSRVYVNQIRSQMLSIAETGAVAFNGDTIDSFNDTNIKGNPSYLKIKKQLQEIRDINRRQDVYVKYAYIIKPMQNSREYVFVADAEEGIDFSSRFGDMFPTDLGLLEANGKAYVDKKYTEDHWGKWISAYGPIYNARGKNVGYLGIDVSSKFIAHESHSLIYYGLVSLAISLIISLIIAHFLSRLVTNSLSSLCTAVNKIGEGNLEERIHLDTHDEFDELAYSINTMAKGLEERDRLKSGFARYVSGYVLDKILKSDIQTQLTGERRKVTLLFSDIRGFTSLAEQMEPEQVVGILNEYFKHMIEIIFRYNGTLDKFMGDGIMVEFGAPLDDEYQEKNALYAAIAMQKEANRLSEIWIKENKPKLNIGIGIHTGYAIVGNIGSDIRMEYTAIGDAVNVASRIEQATKIHKKKILLSEDTKNAVADLAVFTKIENVVLPGKEEPIDLYCVDPETIELPEKHV